MYDKAIQLIKQFEGFRSNPYKCSANVWTIGYGSTVLYNNLGIIEAKVDKNTQSLTKELAEFHLNKHLKGFVAPVIDKYVNIDLNENQYCVLLSFIYNIGGGNFSKSDALKALNAGDFEAFEKEFKEWRMAGGKVLQGLVRRRKAELELFKEI